MENVDPQPMDLVEPTKPPAPPAAQPETAVAPESAKAPEPAKAEEPAKEAPAEEPVVEAAPEEEPAAEEPAKAPEAEEAEDDEEDEEDEAPKPGLYNGSQIVEGKRARKSTERIVIEEPQKKKVAVGAGTPLGEMAEVDELMREAKNKDALEDLHRVVFKTKGAKGKVRKNLAAFAGFVYEDEAKEKPRLLDRLAKFKNGQITAMLDLCRVDRSAKSFEGKVDKEKLIGRLVEFLEKPSSSLQKAAPKRKRAPAKKAPKKKADSEDEDDDDEEVMPVSYVLPRPFPIAARACRWGLHYTASTPSTRPLRPSQEAPAEEGRAAAAAPGPEARRAQGQEGRPDLRHGPGHRDVRPREPRREPAHAAVHPGAPLRRRRARGAFEGRVARPQGAHGQGRGDGRLRDEVRRVQGRVPPAGREGRLP